MASRGDVADLLQALHALYPNSSPIPKGLSEEREGMAVARLARPWHAILGDLPSGVLELAVKQLASSNREFFPGCADFRSRKEDFGSLESLEGVG